MAVNGVEIKHGQVWRTNFGSLVQVVGRQPAVQGQKTQGWLVKRLHGFYPEYFVSESGAALRDLDASWAFQFSLRTLLPVDFQVSVQEALVEGLRNNA